MTLILVTILIAFLSINVLDLFKRLNPNIFQGTLMRPRELESTGYSPKNNGFDIAFGFPTDLDSTIGYISLKEIEMTYDYKTNQRSKKSRDINFEKCGNYIFNFDNEQMKQEYGIAQLNCLTDNYELMGSSYYSPKLQYVELKVWKCQNSTN